MLAKVQLLLILVISILSHFHVESFRCSPISSHRINRFKSPNKLVLHSTITTDSGDNNNINNNVIRKEEIKKIVSLPSWARPHGEDGELFREITAGLVVALATIPTSISYATVIGLNPLAGIWSSVVVGLVVSLIGGGPGLIAGAAGVVALPMAKIYNAYGLQHMSAAVILAGIIEIIFGKLKLGKLADHVTEPVIVGFLNAFAIFLFKSQLKIFYAAMGNQIQLASSLFITILCAFIINISPKISKKIPPSLFGLVISSLVAIVFKFPVETLASVYKGSFNGGLLALPSFIGLPTSLLSLSSSSSLLSSLFKTLAIILPTSIGVATISILETLLASRIACDVYRCRVDVYEESNPDKLILGLGLGNAMSALVGGFGGCGLIPNTLLNGKSGGEGYASSYSFALFLSILIIFFAPLIGAIPTSALGGLMINVAFNTFDWKQTFHLIKDAFRIGGGDSSSSNHSNENNSITHDNDNDNNNNSNSKLQPMFDLLALLSSMAICYKIDMGLGTLVGVFFTKIPRVIHSVQKKISSFTSGNSSNGNGSGRMMLSPN